MVGFISVPAVVRLKRLHEGDCVGSNAACTGSDPFDDLGSVCGAILLMIGKHVSEEGLFLPILASVQAR